MVEGEHELCLVEPPLELGEEMPLQVQVQLLEEMQDMEALAAEGAAEEGAVTDMAWLGLLLLLVQQQMEVSAELEAMEAAAAVEGMEATLGLLVAIVQEQEIQQELVALGEEVEAAEMLEGLVH